MVRLPLKGTMRIAWVGQCSEQAPQAVPNRRTMQLRRTKRAFPMERSFFSSGSRGSMAPVGQALPQAVHSYWQYPRR
ncbi:hypothetical protein MASR2M79_01670 [Aminivibrio sp.]